MHETMVAQSLLEMISAEAAKRNARPIGAKISCGMLNPVNDEILSFAFGAIAKSTVCEDLKLEIEHKPMNGQCKNCDSTFELELSHLVCPKCDGKDFELLPNEPLTLEEIEFQTE
ncbi:MAG: hydrogenase maturation nickel metallochaperone HypA [Planctomycetes bacterium]|nr:hydrogenase maturation nickel metallochaperone HypA [Planctomycetota bacterium]